MNVVVWMMVALLTAILIGGIINRSIIKEKTRLGLPKEWSAVMKELCDVKLDSEWAEKGWICMGRVEWLQRCWLITHPNRTVCAIVFDAGNSHSKLVSLIPAGYTLKGGKQ